MLPRPTQILLLWLLGTLLPSGDSRGEVRRVTYYSRYSGRLISVKLYTPPDYTKRDVRYPVVYALFGDAKEADRQWNRIISTLDAGISTSVLS
jgi:predicted alpha/beta superfamily hydrolase